MESAVPPSLSDMKIAGDVPDHPLTWQSPMGTGDAVKDAKAGNLNSGEEKPLDVGWKVVRAKKKRSSGNGAPTRPESDFQSLGDNATVEMAGNEMVSPPHWTAPAPSPTAQVRQPVWSPTIENFSNSKPDSLKPACPLSSLGLLDKEEIGNGSKSDLNDHIMPNHPNSCGPPLPRSSAGHTPYSSRLSLMARDLRLGRVGRGPPILLKDPKFTSGPDFGFNLGSKSTISSDLGLNRGPDAAAICENQKNKGFTLPAEGNGNCSISAKWPAHQNSQQVMDSSIHPDRGEEDGLPNEINGPVLTEIHHPEFARRNTDETGMDKNESLDSGLGLFAGHGSARN